MRIFTCIPEIAQPFLILSHREAITYQRDGKASNELAGKKLSIRLRNTAKRSNVFLDHSVDDGTGLFVHRTKLRNCGVMHDQKHVSESVVLCTHYMCLFMQPDVWKVSAATISILSVVEGIEAVRSACPPRPILVHELAVARDAMPVFPKREVAHVTKMGDGACRPN